MIVFGEKRPPADMLEQRPRVRAIDISSPSNPANEASSQPLVQPDHTERIRVTRGAMDTNAGQTASRSLPSIPEDNVSLVGPESGRLGANVESMLASILQLRKVAGGDQQSYRMYTYLKRSFSQAIQDTLIHADAQICIIQRKAQAPSADTPSLELQMLRQERMQPEWPEAEEHMARTFAIILNYSLRDYLAITQATERRVGELLQERTHLETETNQVPHAFASVAVGSTSVSFTAFEFEVLQASDSFLKLLGPCYPGVCLKDWTSQCHGTEFLEQLTTFTNMLVNSEEEDQVSFSSPWSLQSPFLKRSGTRIECNAHVEIFDSEARLGDDDDEESEDAHVDEPWDNFTVCATLTDITFVSAVARSHPARSKKRRNRLRGSKRIAPAGSSSSDAHGFAVGATGMRHRAPCEARPSTCK